MKKKIIIFGVSELARVALNYFKKENRFDIVGFVADKEFLKEDQIFNGCPCFSTEEAFSKFSTDEYMVFIAINSMQLNYSRTKVYNRFKEKGYKFASYISPHAFIWDDVKIGDNAFILENNVLQTGVTIGDNVTLWSGNHIGHGSTIGDNVFISSHCVISGMVEVGNNTFFGVNSCVADQAKIGKDNFIAMGAVVNKSTEDDMLMLGNPAQPRNISAKKFCKVK